MVVDSSRPIAHVAREIGVHEITLGYWVKGYREKCVGEEPLLELSDRARLRELERGKPRAEDEVRVPLISSGVLCGGASVNQKYEFIDAEYAASAAADTAHAPTIIQMCHWLAVSRSEFYDWRTRPESATTARRQELTLLITQAFEDSDGTYGYRRVHAQLARWGVSPPAWTWSAT